MLRAPVTVLLALSLLLAACGAEEEETPTACFAGADGYLQALRGAPGEVRIDGTSISDCLVPSQPGGELAEVGSGMVAAATRLNEGARADPTGSQAFQLGYLIGAAQRGAEETAGIHTDLIRRLNSAARFDPAGIPPASFERTFGRGFQAGRESG